MGLSGTKSKRIKTVTPFSAAYLPHHSTYNIVLCAAHKTAGVLAKKETKHYFSCGIF